jgi:ribosome-binding protein aMBF1 (putative translation factor)
MAKSKDFLDELVQGRMAKNPQFPALVAEVQARRAIAQRLAKKRERSGLSQTVVAARMGTSASVVSKLESGSGVKVSTLQRYYSAIGESFNLK